MAKIHVLLKKEELDHERLEGKTVLVLDVLFATSTIAAALADGATEVIPTQDGAAARRVAAGSRSGSYVMAGELNAITLDGFAAPSPLALVRENVRGRAVIYSTTNGTVALHKAARAPHVYAAALLNGAAVIRHVTTVHPDETLLIVCAGSIDQFNLEDFYGAGHLIALLQRNHPGHEYSDAAIAAGLFTARIAARDCLRAGRIGRMMVERGLEDEVDYSAQSDLLDVVPRFDGTRLRAVISAAPVAAAGARSAR